MKALLILTLLFILPLSCKNNNDIFAEIKGDNITRGEFNDWLESRGIPAESVYKDRIAMSDFLSQIAVEKLTAVKAESVGYNNDNSYKTIEDTLNKNLLATYYTDKISDNIIFNEKAADISIIRIFLKKEKTPESIRENEDKKRVIQYLLNELKSGRDFNELAVKYSEDALSQKKGRMGILPENVMEDSIRTAVSILSENEYTKEPLAIGNSLCLIKLHKRYDLNEKNIKSVVTEKQNAERIIDFYKNKQIDDIRVKIINERSIISNIETASFAKVSEVIFSIDGESFTSGQLDDILKLFYSLKYGIPNSEMFSLKEKRMTSEKILKERLFASEAEKKHLNDELAFKRNWMYLKRATLAGAYKYNILMNKLSVTNEEIMKDYEQNKNLKYYSIKKIGNREKKQFLAYNDVRLSIKNQISRERLKALKKKWDNEILNEGNYKIINQDFSVD